MDPGEVLTRSAAFPDAVLRYAARPDAVVDVHVPAGDGPWPLVVLLHGGFWKRAYDRVHTRPMARALVDEGCLVAVPEYRRVGGGGGWPVTADDVRDAVESLPDLLAGLGLRASTYTLAGHSAGGQLALWLAATPIRLRPASVEPPKDRRRIGVGAGGWDRVVALAPVADLRQAAADRLGGGAVAELLGGEPEDVPDRYEAADPLALLRGRDARDVGPLTVLHGADDEDVPVGQSRALAAACPAVDLVELPGTEHYGLIDPLSPAWPEVLKGLTWAGGAH